MGRNIFKSDISRSRRTGVYNIKTGLQTTRLKFNSARFPCKCITHVQFNSGVRGGAVGLGTALQAGRSRIRRPMVSMEFFIDIILPGRTMTLGLTQPLTENSIRIISWGKGGRCVGLKTLSSSCADCLEIWEPLNILESSEPVQACNGIALPLALQSNTTLHITVPC